MKYYEIDKLIVEVDGQKIEVPINSHPDCCKLTFVKGNKTHKTFVNGGYFISSLFDNDEEAEGRNGEKTSFKKEIIKSLTHNQ